MSSRIKEFINKAGDQTFNAMPATEPIIYVAIDVAKYYQKAIIFDINKRILEQPFGFDLSKDGFNKLIMKVDFHAQKQQAKKIAVGMEATGPYYKSLVEHFRVKGYEIFIINPYATFKIRELNFDRVKTDELDVKAIGEAMLLGKGNKIANESEVYHQLKLLTRFRRAKIKTRRGLKNQMLIDLDRLWPGLVKDTKNNNTGLFVKLWKSKIARKLLQLNMLPQEIARLSPQEFLKICKAEKMKNVGINWANKIIGRASHVLPCETGEADIHKQIIQINLKQLKDLDDLIEDLERNIAVLFHRTPAVCLLSIQGVNAPTAAEFISEIGDPFKYAWPGAWVKLAGLNASRCQSGKMDREENPITKTGNRYLRETVFTIARNISRWDPFFIAYRDKFLARGKHILKVYGAVANKFLRVAFYMIQREVNFDPDYENKKDRPCLIQSGPMKVRGLKA